MYSKAQIYNLALGALLLSRRISNPETDKSNEAVILNTNWETAFYNTLADLDLDGTSSQVTLELIQERPNNLWLYSYKYPTNCAFFRRIQSCATIDNRDTHIPKRTSVINGVKVILTNEPDAIAEYLPKDLPLEALSAPAGLCVAFALAQLSSPLAVGKGAAKLIKDIESKYVLTKANAQELDRSENFSFTNPETESEWVAARVE